MAPRPKFFVSASRLQKQRLNPRKSVQGYGPGEESSLAAKLDTIEQDQEKSCLFWRRNYKKKSHNLDEGTVFSSTTKLGWTWESDVEHNETVNFAKISLSNTRVTQFKLNETNKT